MVSGMFGIGLLELLFICLPILVILGLVGLGIYVYDRNRRLAQQNQSQLYQPGVAPSPAAPRADRYCSHCGAALQADWSHCPQCGAPIP
jgi:uncharacterized paraquat-inducible protein A